MKRDIKRWLGIVMIGTVMVSGAMAQGRGTRRDGLLEALAAIRSRLENGA